MKAPCIASIITIAVAAYFWIAWLNEMERHVIRTEIVIAMLEEDGLTKVSTFPKSLEADGRYCYSWVGFKDDYEQVSGEVCLEGAE